MRDQIKDMARNGLEIVVHTLDPALFQKTNKNQIYPQH